MVSTIVNKTCTTIMCESGRLNSAVSGVKLEPSITFFTLRYTDNFQNCSRLSWNALNDFELEFKFKSVAIALIEDLNQAYDAGIKRE